MPLQSHALISLCLAVMVSSCGEESGGSRTVTDDIGRVVTLPDTIRRIVTLAPNVTEIAYAAGAAGRVVAVTTADDHPPAVESLPRIGVLPLDFEALLQHKPDLVLAAEEANSPRDAEALVEFGVPVYFLSFDGVSDIVNAVKTVGELIGTGPHASNVADSLRWRLSDLSRNDVSEDQRPDVLFLIGVETLYSFGGDSYVNEMIRLAGGRSVTENLSTRAPVLSDEFVLTSAPDVILGAFNDITAERLLRARPAWEAVPAVHQGRVHAIDPDLVLRPGPRVVDGVAEMRRLLTGAEAGPRE